MGGHLYTLELDGPEPPEAALLELSMKGLGHLVGWQSMMG